MDGYTLSRKWFDFSFENPEKISPSHSAIYFFAIEQWNRMGQKDKFGFPSYFAMDAIGIKKHQTYKKHFNDLVEWGFINLIQESKNQYTSCIIALPKNGKAHGKALDKANVMQGAKQVEGMVTINKQVNKETNKQEINTWAYEKENEYSISGYLMRIFLKLGYEMKTSQKEFSKWIIGISEQFMIPLDKEYSGELWKKIADDFYTYQLSLSEVNKNLKNAFKNNYKLAKWKQHYSN